MVVSDDDYTMEGSADEISASDMDIDPVLSEGVPHSTKRKVNNGISFDSRAPLNFEDDDDDYEMPEPVNWSSDEDYEDADDDLNDGYSLRDNLKVASGFKVRGKKASTKGYRQRAMRVNKSNDPELNDHLSRANEAFVRGDLSIAWKHYSEVIKLDSKNFNAYKTLGEICQMRGNINKCCFFWLLAAESGEADAEFWGLVAEMSSELGHIDQAIHCYTQAIGKSDGTPMHFITERSLLYREKKHYVRALEGFQRLLRAYPSDTSIIRHVAGIYAEQKRFNDAVNLYMQILDSNLHPKPNREYPIFGWTELNITCELLTSQESWTSGIQVIKVVARWMQGRENETWWEEQDDSEFDEHRRHAFLRAKKPSSSEALMQKDYSLPIDIRFKLGLFRLSLDQKDEAVAHFNFLFEQEEKHEMLDLFFDAGSGLEAQNYHAEAVPFLRFLFEQDENAESDILLGKCLLEIESFSEAKTVLMRTLRSDPTNVDVKLILIEALYHTGEMDLATTIMEDISKTQISMIAQKSLDPQQENQSSDTEESAQDDNAALIRNSSYYKKIRKNDLDEDDRRKIEEDATRAVRGKFNRMKRLQEAIDDRHEPAIVAWLKLASQLIEMFVEIRSFFPKSQKTVFKGIAIYKKKKTLALNEKLHRIRELFEGYTESENSRIVMTSKTEFRGLDYDTWFWIFVQYAYMVKQFRNDVKEAIETIELAMNVSVFKIDKTKIMLLRLVSIALGILQEDYAISVSNNVRFYLNATQFSPSIYNFFMCCFGSGIAAWAVFSNYNHQKFFLRQIKAYDSLLFSTKVPGAAQLAMDIKDFKAERENPHLLYIYACLLGNNRAFSSPIVYLTRAYKQYYNDPTICFCLGLAHIHRSMQRNTNNRQIQLLQGISYLMEYKSAREKNATNYEKQEIEYNYGRMFHMIGLPTLAVKHYEKVLSYHDDLNGDSDYDMSAEAAYNLSLIFTISGNTELARSLIEKYLTI